MENEQFFTVFVGGVEVNDYLLTLNEALRIRTHYQKQGYDDVAITLIEEVNNGSSYLD